MTLGIAVIMAYGVFCLAGGAVGFLKAKSVVSLITGAVAGLVLLVSGQELMQGNRQAALVVMLVALLLTGRFAATWRTNRRVMPDLVMTVWGALTLVLAGLLLASP